MSAQKGKDLLLKLDGDGNGTFATVAGMRSRAIAFNTETVDITHVESSGRWRELLAGAGAKHAKMSLGPFPFLRATYWRWAETILDVCPDLSGAPQVLAVGDIHLENYGTWRDDDGRLIWGVNDFDEAADMPYVLDLLRLATSATIGCPSLDSVGNVAANILRGYAEGLAEGRLVRRGERIGYVGTTGNAPPQTPHLHFAIFKLGPEKRWWEGVAINPFPVWAAGRAS